MFSLKFQGEFKSTDWDNETVIFKERNIWSCFVCLFVWVFLFCFVFFVHNYTFFMGVIFCSSVALVWTFHTRGVSNFITKKANILVNFVPFFNDVWFLFCRLFKSGVTNQLKNIRVIYSKQDKTLLLVKH